MNVTPQYLGQSIDEVEVTIRRLNVEVACLFNPAGDLIFAEQGSEHDLDLSDAQVALMLGNTLTHNHPSAMDSFSVDDVALAWDGGLTELRMVNQNFTFSLTGMPAFYGWWEVAETIQALMRQVIEDRDNGLVDADKVFDALWRKVAERLGLTYTRAEETR